MPSRSANTRHVWRIAWSAVLATASVVLPAQRAEAIAVFARKYRTACITCHAGYPKLNAVGEAFRRNGYQFPRRDFEMVQERPIPLGTAGWKEMWPDSIWPNDLPLSPPVAFRGRLGYNVFLDHPEGEPETDFRFPLDFSLLSGGTLGENISWYAGYVLAGKGAHGSGGHGGHGGDDSSLRGELERLFVQFDNLFAWSDEEDADGFRLANPWLALPKHAVNLRIGQFDPGVVAPWASIHRQLGIQARLPNLVTVGGNHFAFEPALRGIELNGVLRNYYSYAVGLVNGSGTEQAWDNNSDKDFYFRVARKWWGYPLDGQVATIAEQEAEPEVEVSMQHGPPWERQAVASVSRGQSPEEDGGAGSPGLEFWRETSFETGFFGYSGRNMASETTVQLVSLPTVGAHNGAHNGPSSEVTLEVPTTITRVDRFERIGLDARWTRRDLDIYGVWFWGWNRDPISHAHPTVSERDALFAWFVEANYYYKPWLIWYARYEQVDYRDEHAGQETDMGRGVVGAAGYIRNNIRLVGEVVLDAKGNDTTNDTAQLLLDFAY